MLDPIQPKKDRTDASIYQQLFIIIRDRYRDYIPVYTDGSRDRNSVACAIGFVPIKHRNFNDIVLFIFAGEIWARIKIPKQIFYFFTDSCVSF